MEINRIPVHNPQPNPALSKYQRFIIESMLTDPIDVINSAALKVLEEPTFMTNYHSSNRTGTSGSLIDLIV